MGEGERREMMEEKQPYQERQTYQPYQERQTYQEWGGTQQQQYAGGPTVQRGEEGGPIPEGTLIPSLFRAPHRARRTREKVAYPRWSHL